MANRRTPEERSAWDRARLREIAAILDDAARDMHGVYYEPQATLQRVADAIGRAAPDRVTHRVAMGSETFRFSSEHAAREHAAVWGGVVVEIE